MPIQVSKFYSKAHLVDAMTERANRIDKTSMELSRIQLMLVKHRHGKHQVTDDRAIEGLEKDDQIAIHNAIYDCYERLEEASSKLTKAIWSLQQEND